MSWAAGIDGGWISRTRPAGVLADLDRSIGAGPEVRGNGEALALAIVGRRAVLGSLERDGVAILADRIAEQPDAARVLRLTCRTRVSGADYARLHIEVSATVTGG